MQDRSDSDPAHRFDLTRLFETPADADRVADETDEAVADLRSRIDDLDGDAALERGPEAIAAVLDDYADALRRLQDLDVYTQLRASLDTGDDDRAASRRRVEELTAGFEATKDALVRALATLDVDADSLADPDQRAFVRNCRARADRVPPAAVADALATLDGPLSAPERTVRAIKATDLNPGTVAGPDGDPVEVTRGNRRTHLRSPDREFRRRVDRAVREELLASKGAISRAVVDRAREHVARADLRGYDSAREAALTGEAYPETGYHVALPESVHDTMLSAVADNVGPYHRLAEARRERVDGDDLRPWDTEVPVVADADPGITFERAREHVVAAMAPMGEAYQNRVASLLSERRVDAYPAPEKRDVAAMCPFAYDGGPFVFTNFREDVPTTFYLAHELGHAVQQTTLAEENGPLTTTLGHVHEVNSLLHELLLADHLLDAGDAAMQAAVHDRLLSLVGGNLFSSAQGAAFNHRVFELVADGEDPGFDRLREVAADLRETYNPVLVPDDAGDVGWLEGMYSREPYYHAEYVLGITGALVTHEGLVDGELSPEGYREFLVDDALDPVAAFDSLGTDVTSADAFAAASEAFAGYLDDALAFAE